MLPALLSWAAAILATPVPCPLGSEGGANDERIAGRVVAGGQVQNLTVHAGVEHVKVYVRDAFA